MNVSKCHVSYMDTQGRHHEVDVTASTLYEAVASAINAFRRDALLRGEEYIIGTGTQFSVTATAPSVTHTVSTRHLENYLGSGKSPKEKVERDRIKALMDGP